MAHGCRPVESTGRARNVAWCNAGSFLRDMFVLEKPDLLTLEAPLHPTADGAGDAVILQWGRGHRRICRRRRGRSRRRARISSAPNGSDAVCRVDRGGARTRNSAGRQTPVAIRKEDARERSVRLERASDRRARQAREEGEAEEGEPEATILPFCIHKHVSIERMAQRIARYDEKRALAALHSEGEVSFRAWVAAGYPEHIAQNLACQYEPFYGVSRFCLAMNMKEMQHHDRRHEKPRAGGNRQRGEHR